MRSRACTCEAWDPDRGRPRRGLAVGVAFAVLPLAALLLMGGLLVAGVGVPIVSGLLGRETGRFRSAVRGHLAAELVDIVRGAPRLVVYGREEESIRRLRATDAMLARLARETRSRPASPTGSGSWWQERPRLRCSPSPSPRSSGDLDRVLVAALVFLALASFEAVAPLPLAAREQALAAGGRVLELTDREPMVEDPPAPVSAPRGTPRSRSRA